MQRSTMASAFAAAGLTVCLLSGQPVKAGPPVAGLVGKAQSSVPGCPYLGWRLARHNDGSITGIAYYLDASGASMVTGTVNQAGEFHLTLKPAMGNGPVGTVVGKRSPDGSAVADLTGEGCANMHVAMQPAPDLAKQYDLGG